MPRKGVLAVVRRNRVTAGQGEAGLSGRAIMTGLIITLALALAIAVVVSILIYFTDMSEGSAASYIYYLGMMCVAVGGAAGARGAGRLGWLHGGLVGLLYAVLSLALTFIILPGPVVFGAILGRIGTVTLVGALGGVIGVNV
ncbi:MAG: TIGR04086 family membrane protein [Bacillota bacterium]